MMRKFRLFGVLLLVFVLFPSHAFALDIWPNGSYWAGSTGDGNYASFVRADNLYDAAVYGLNEDPEKLTDEVKAKLSDPSYGGDFYTYAQTFYNVDSWENVPDWLPTYVMFSLTGVIHTWERVFASETSSSLRQSALADYRRVLAGDDLGGGGSGGTGGTITLGDYYPVSSFSWADDYSDPSSIYDITAQNATFSNGELTIGTGTTVCSPYVNSPNYVNNARFYLSPDVVDVVNSFIDAGLKVSISESSFIASSDLYVYYGDHPFPNMHENLRYLRSGSRYISVYDMSVSPVYYDGELFLFCNSVNDNFENWGNGYFTPRYFTDVIDSPIALPPNGDWPEPETPVTPDPPEVPTPTAPTVTPEPTPTEPTVIWPTAPIVVNPPEVTVEVTPTGLDYTELLTRINDNLNSIDSYAQAINSGLNSLRPDIIGGFDDVVSAIRNIYTYLQHLDSILERHCKHLRDALDDGIYNLELYIKSLFEWLPNQLNYDAEFTYDDSAVTTLLRRILNKIPGGSTDIPVSYEPNPQADEPGFFDWLLDLWHRFLIDLVSVLPDELGALVDAFSQLTHYFPFSIPWDLFALLSLFEHEPVTPVFDVPWGFGGDEGEIQMVRVDLSAWDGVMEMVRPVFLVGFCWQLAMITKELLANFDINKGGV